MPLYLKIFKEVADKYGKKAFSHEDIARTFGLNEEGTFRILTPDSWQEATEELYRKYDEGIVAQNLQTSPGIRPLLDFLKERGVKIALITGKADHTCRTSLRQLGLESTFSSVQCGNPFTQSKHTAMKHLLDEYKLEPQELVYIGDALSDVELAHKAGVECFSAAWCESADIPGLEKINPGKVFTTVDSLKAYLEPLI